MYLRDVEPVLRAGMEFLRDEGATIGCYANRYVTVVKDGRPTERSYGMSWWRSLAAAGALGRVAPDARGDLRRGDAVPVDARARPPG